jgi:hypothetical protein
MHVCVCVCACSCVWVWGGGGEVNPNLEQASECGLFAQSAHAVCRIGSIVLICQVTSACVCVSCHMCVCLSSCHVWGCISCCAYTCRCACTLKCSQQLYACTLYVCTSTFLQVRWRSFLFKLSAARYDRRCHSCTAISVCCRPYECVCTCFANPMSVCVCFTSWKDLAPIRAFVVMYKVHKKVWSKSERPLLLLCGHVKFCLISIIAEWPLPIIHSTDPTSVF